MIGHRGAAALAVPNSIEALQIAAAAGADIVELDIGGDLLLGHPGDELPEPPVGLAEALAALAATPVGIQLDLKAVGIEAQLAALVEASGLGERVCVSSTWARSLRRLEREAPALTRIVSYPRDRFGAAGVAWPKPLTRSSAAALRAFTPARARLLLARSGPAAALSLHHALVSPAVVASVHARNAALLAWTVNDPARIIELARRGVDAVVTDDPQMALGALATLGVQ